VGNYIDFCQLGVNICACFWSSTGGVCFFLVQWEAVAG
jgi:hypothetical protein